MLQDCVSHAGDHESCRTETETVSNKQSFKLDNSIAVAATSWNIVVYLLVSGLVVDILGAFCDVGSSWFSVLS